jgi:hypothetical protein
MNLSPHKAGDWWNGLTIPQVLTKGPEEGAVYAPKDLTGVVVTMQVKARATDEVALLEFRSDGADPKITITEPYGPVVVAGQIIDLPARTYAFDVEFCFPGTRPKTYVDGEWPITQDVTRRTYA